MCTSLTPSQPLINMLWKGYNYIQNQTMIIPQQVFYCNQKLINFGTFIREYFRLKPVSSTDNNIQTEKQLDDKTFTFLLVFSSHSTRPKNGTRQSRSFHDSQVFVWRPIAWKPQKSLPCPAPPSSPRAPPAQVLSPPASSLLDVSNGKS